MKLLQKLFFILILLFEVFSSVAQVDTPAYQYVDILTKKVGLIPLKESGDLFAMRLWLNGQVIDISLSKDTCGRIISFADEWPILSNMIDLNESILKPVALADTLDDEITITIYNMVRRSTPKSNLHDNYSVSVSDGNMYFLESIIESEYNLTAYHFTTMEVFPDKYACELHFFDSLKLLSKSEDHYDKFKQVLMPGQYVRDYVVFTVFTEEEKARQLLFADHNLYIKSINDSIEEMFRITFQKYPKERLYDQKGGFTILFSKNNRVNKIFYPHRGGYWNPIKKLITQIRLRQFINRTDLNFIHANYYYCMSINFSYGQCHLRVLEIG